MLKSPKYPTIWQVQWTHYYAAINNDDMENAQDILLQ